MKAIVLGLMLAVSAASFAKEGQGKFGEQQREKRFGRGGNLRDGVTTVCQNDKGRTRCTKTRVKYVGYCEAESWTPSLRPADRLCRRP